MRNGAGPGEAVHVAAGMRRGKMRCGQEFDGGYGAAAADEALTKVAGGGSFSGTRID
jgi:hypothetical protein